MLGAHLEDEAVEEEADGGEEDDEGREREEIVVRRVGLALPVHLRQEPPRRRAEPHAPAFFPNPQSRPNRTPPLDSPTAAAAAGAEGSTRLGPIRQRFGYGQEWPACAAEGRRSRRLGALVSRCVATVAFRLCVYFCEKEEKRFFFPKTPPCFLPKLPRVSSPLLVFFRYPAFLYWRASVAEIRTVRKIPRPWGEW